MKKIYLVDSENVGDVWVPLLAASQGDEQVLVFYTQKSPHMNYENVRLLKETERGVVFIKCFEGNNALDFQLVTELGYRLRENTDCEYVIVSNDTGFDAAVRYWNERNMPVSRLSGKECFRQVTGKGKQTDRRTKEKTGSENLLTEQETTSGSSTENCEPAEDTAKAEILQETVIGQEQSSMETAADESTIKTLFCCISKDHLADFHNALVMFFGEEVGKELYQEIKGNPEWTVYWTKVPENSQKEKFEMYCRLVFEHSELADDYSQDFSAFLFKAKAKRKNLNSLRAALQGQYGKDKGMKYYSLFKSHIKIMNRM